MSIEPARLAEATAIAALVNAAYRGASAEAGWANEAGLVDGQRTDVAAIAAALAGLGAILVWRETPDDVPIGCVAVEPAEGTTWSLGMLTIDPARQAGGLGRRLLAAGEAFAQAGGAARIRITVIQLRHTLIAWYERRGYRLTGDTRPFPYEDGRFGRPLRDDLHFVVLEKPLQA